jgi:hypothetical protein
MESEEELTPYEYEVACNMQDSFISSVISMIQSQDEEMLVLFCAFLRDTMEEDAMKSIISHAYVWLSKEEPTALPPFHTVIFKLIDQKDIAEARKEVANMDLEESVEESPKIIITPLDISHILLDEGFIEKKDFKTLKRSVKILNSKALKCLSDHLTMDSISSLIKYD